MFRHSRPLRGQPLISYNPTLDGAVFRRTAREYADLREALGDDIDIAMHCTGQFDTRSAISLQGDCTCRSAMDRRPIDRSLLRSLAATDTIAAGAVAGRGDGRK